MKKGFLLFIGICLVAILVGQNAYASTYYEDSIHKLGRGLTNVVTSWLEMFDTIDCEIEEYGWYKGPIFGTLKGVSKFVVRLSAGVYEIITAPIEYPEDYKVLVEPEFVFAREEI